MRHIDRNGAARRRVAWVSRRASGRRRPEATAALIAVCIGASLLGCQLLQPYGDRSPDDNVVRIGVAEDRITLDPSSVPAGEVYLEPPPEGATLISADSTEGEGEFGPVDDATLARLRLGDLQSMTVHLVQGAHGGRFQRSELAPGRYAFAILADDQQPGVPPVAVEVLTVEP